MRSLSVLACLVLATPSFGAVVLLPEKFKVGQVGEFRQGTTQFEFRVIEVIDKETMEVRCGTMPAFLVAKFATADYADDQKFELKGEFKVTGKKKVGRRTLWVVEPVRK